MANGMGKSFFDELDESFSPLKDNGMI